MWRERKIFIKFFMKNCKTTTFPFPNNFFFLTEENEPE